MPPRQQILIRAFHSTRGCAGKEPPRQQILIRAFQSTRGCEGKEPPHSDNDEATYRTMRPGLRG
jgi:hypothetical protein